MAEIACERAAQIDAGAIIAFDRNGAGACDQNIAGHRTVGTDAEAVAAGGEGAVQIAVIVRIGRRVRLIDNDLAAQSNAAGNARGDVDTGHIGLVVDLDGALVIELVIAVDDHAAGSGPVHDARGVDQNVVRQSAGLDRRGPERAGHGRRNGGFCHSGSGQRDKAGRGKQVMTHQIPHLS